MNSQFFQKITKKFSPKKYNFDIKVNKYTHAFVGGYFGSILLVGGYGFFQGYNYSSNKDSKFSRFCSGSFTSLFYGGLMMYPLGYIWPIAMPAMLITLHNYNKQ